MVLSRFLLMQFLAMGRAAGLGRTRKLSPSIQAAKTSEADMPEASADTKGTLHLEDFGGRFPNKALPRALRQRNEDDSHVHRARLIILKVAKMIPVQGVHGKVLRKVMTRITTLCTPPFAPPPTIGHSQRLIGLSQGGIIRSEYFGPRSDDF